jgi:hypothetical protein
MNVPRFALQRSFAYRIRGVAAGRFAQLAAASAGRRPLAQRQVQQDH